MNSILKIFLIIFTFCPANTVWAQTNDSSDASNSDNSNKVRHGGVPGSTASYTVHDGEVRPRQNVKPGGSSNTNANANANANTNINSTGNGSGGTQTANNNAPTNYTDSFNQMNSQGMPTNGTAPDITANNNNSHFCWGWLGLLGLLGLGGLIKRKPEKV